MVASFILKISKRHNPIVKKNISSIIAEVVARILIKNLIKKESLSRLIEET